MIFTTHNLVLAVEITDRVAVVYNSRIAKLGTAREVFTGSGHPYTHALLETIPRWDGGPGRSQMIEESLVDCGITIDKGAAQQFKLQKNSGVWLSGTHRVTHTPRKRSRGRTDD